MPYGAGEFPHTWKNVDPATRGKAVSILNALLDEGMEEGKAIAVALTKAREWVAKHSADEQFDVAVIVREYDVIQPTWDESKHPRAPAGSPEGGQFVPAAGTGSLTLDTKPYNERRYGKPWIARVDFTSNPKGDYKWGDWIGDPGQAGELSLRGLSAGDIIARGQKDYRKGDSNMSWSYIDAKGQRIGVNDKISAVRGARDVLKQLQASPKEEVKKMALTPEQKNKLAVLEAYLSHNHKDDESYDLEQVEVFLRRSEKNPLESDREDFAQYAEHGNAIRGIEIFKTGTHNGDKYTEQDLDAMVTAFRSLDYVPAIKVGHTKDEPGAPAYGWVKNLRRDGDKLFADFEDMHDSVVDALRTRAYDRVSSEIYFNLKRNDKTYPRALKAVALLGAEVPAVANLTPLHKMQFAADGFESVAACEQALEVPTEAMLSTLAERVTGLINLVKEHDMAKNAERIAELKEQVKAFEAQMDELKKAKKDLTDDQLAADADYKALVAKADEIADKIAELEQEEDEDSVSRIAALEQELAESKKREEAARTEQKAFSERIARMEQKQRNEQIGDRVRACKIPAFRSMLSALYAYALEHAAATVKVYAEMSRDEAIAKCKKDHPDLSGKALSEMVDKMMADHKGKNMSEQTLAEIVDGVVTEINAQSEKLFKALAYTGSTVRADGEVEERADAEVQRRVTEYRVKHPEVKSYEVAMRAVLTADAELAARYREQLGNAQ